MYEEYYFFKYKYQLYLKTLKQNIKTYCYRKRGFKALTHPEPP